MSLTGKTPGNSYKDLLQMDNGNVGIDGTLRSVKDGEGTTCPLQLSSSAVAVTSTPTNSNDVATKGYVDAQNNANGMFLLGEVTLSGTGTQTFTQTTFGATFSDYKLIKIISHNLKTGTTASNAFMQFHVNGTAQTGSVYVFINYGLPFGATATASGANANAPATALQLNAPSYLGTNTSDSNDPTLYFDFSIRHSSSTYPNITGVSGGATYNLYAYTGILSGHCRANGYVTGFNMYPSTSSLSGNILVYGIK